MTGEGTRCQPGERTYPCMNRVGLSPTCSHMGAILPGAEEYSKPASIVTIDRLRMEHAHAHSSPGSAPERYPPYRVRVARC